MSNLKENENFKLLLKILLVFAVSRLIMFIMVPVYNGIMGTDRTFTFLMNEWDAKRYAFMIDNGYTFPLDTDPQANWAFFPLYVLVCMFFKTITFGVIDTYVIGMLVSNVCIIIAAFFAIKWLIKNKNISNEGIILMAVLMFMAPYTFYCSSAYTEAMFIMFIVLFFYFLSDKRYILAGLMAACSSATRIVGCILVFPMIVRLYIDIVQRKLSFNGIKKFVKHMLNAPKKIFAVLICPFGAFVYMTFLRFFCGDVWAYKNVQIAWREDEYFPIIGVMWKACTGQIEPRYTYMGWFCVAILILYGYMFYRKYYAMSVFGIISLLVPLTSHVMSTCRFTIGTYVVFVGVHDILMRCNKVVIWVITAILVAIEIFLLFQWYNSDCWLM